MANAGFIQVSQYARGIFEKWSQLSHRTRLVSVLVATASFVAGSRLLASYRRWKAMGPGGAPSNPLGFAAVLLLECLYARADTKDLGLYDHPDKYVGGWAEVTAEEKAKLRKSFLSRPLPRRAGNESRAKPFVIPQRERNASDPIDPEVKENYLTVLDKLVASNDDIIEWKQSVLEGRGQAMFLKTKVPLPSPARATKHEIGHIHRSDLSGHCTLSFVDAREVIGKGWGERHRLSGTNVLPLGYTMIYVPRSTEEVEMYREIFQASIEYMRSNGE